MYVVLIIEFVELDVLTLPENIDCDWKTYGENSDINQSIDK